MSNARKRDEDFPLSDHLRWSNELELTCQEDYAKRVWINARFKLANYPDAPEKMRAHWRSLMRFANDVINATSVSEFFWKIHELINLEGPRNRSKRFNHEDLEDDIQQAIRDTQNGSVNAIAKQTRTIRLKKRCKDPTIEIPSISTLTKLIKSL